MSSLRLLLVVMASVPSVAATAEQIPTDWDLYMLKLVNAARVDPAAENQLRDTNYSNPPVPPLAYNLLVGQAAENHTHWMSLNANNPAIQNPFAGNAPDSFAHRETYNGQSSGSPATDTPGFTGASVGDRLEYVGYNYSSWGENIIWGSFPSIINASTIVDNHVGWWNSSGHRDNLMSATFTVFGNHQLSDFDHWATQNFSRPSGTRTHLSGVLYDDLNESGDWNPPSSPGGSREGLGNVAYRVYQSGTSNQVGSDAITFDNGGFSFRTGDGVYDIQFLLNDGDRWVRDLAIHGTNLDVGDIEAVAPPSLAGDYNNSGQVEQGDLDPVLLNWGESWPPEIPGWINDQPADGTIDQNDLDGVLLNWGDTISSSASVVPEPATPVLVLGALGLLALRRRN